MAVTPEATEHIERLMEHIRQVEGGVIPRATPVDFIISDWSVDSPEARAWVGPRWPEVQAALDTAETQLEQA